MQLRLIIISLIVLLSFRSEGQSIGYTDLYNSSNFSRTIDISKAVGSIDGTADVNLNGAATYTIPIKCPPGTHGLVPGISIVYNSQGDNGLLGKGWTLSGLSTITRSGKDIYHDGKVAVVSYTNNDAFVMDGTRLSVTSGSNGADGSNYRTEAESYTVVTSKGTSGTGPLYFNVVSKDGTLMQYGYTSSSRVMTEDGTNNVMIWRLNRIQDVNGNYMDFTYDNSGRDSRILKIQYTGNVNTGLAAYNEINFEYGVRDDKNVFYDNGNTIQSNYLLNKINVTEIGGDLFKSYRFEYGKNKSISFLKIIKEVNGNGEQLNDTRFLYGNDGSNFTQSTSDIDLPYIASSTATNTDIFSGDFNGDGKTDILTASYKGKSGTPVYAPEKNYSGFSILQATGLGEFTQIPGASVSGISDGKYLVNFNSNNGNPNFISSDFDGDGKDDILFMKNTDVPAPKLDGFVIYYSRPGTSGFNFEIKEYDPAVIAPNPLAIPGMGEPHLLVEKNNMLIGDFDGDKRTDFLYFTRTSEYYGGVSHYTNHSFLSFPGKEEMNNRLMQTGTPSVEDNNLTRSFMTNDVYVIDFDGDGKSEIMFLYHDKTYVYTISKSSSGYYYYELLHESTYPTSDTHDMYGTGDFNGDGKTDFVTKLKSADYWEVWFSSGKSWEGKRFYFDAMHNFQTKCEYNNPFPGVTNHYMPDRLFIGDYNGDGKSDLLHERSYCDLSNNTKSDLNLYTLNSFDNTNITLDFRSYFLPGKIVSGGIIRPMITDVDGDGKNEFCFRASNSTMMQTLYVDRNSQSSRMTMVNDGLNRAFEFAYKKITDGTGTGSGDFFTKGTGETYPVNNGQFPIYVVVSMVAPNGLGSINPTIFKYENLRLHRGGKGLLGFEKIRSYNPVTNNSSESLYELNRDFYISYLKTKKESLYNTGTLLGQIDYATSFTRIGSGYCFEQKSNSTTTQDLLKGITTTTSNTYDAFGNITQAVNSVNAGLEITTTNTTYITPPSSVIPTLPSSVTITQQRSGQPSVSKTTGYTYTGWNPTKITDFSGMAAAVDKVLDYDNYGNVKSHQTQQALVSASLWPKVEYTYDTKGRFRISEKNPLGQSSTTSYHKFWGKLISATSISGVTTTYEYDAWGKLILVNMPGPYSVTYSDGWDITGNKRYYTLVEHPGAPDVKTWYDELGRGVQADEEAYGGAWTTQNTTYDAKGNVAITTNSHLSSESPELTSNSYDDYNRLISSESVFGMTTYNYSYGGGNMVVAVTKPSGQTMLQTTDAAGKTISSTDNGGTMLFTYDSWGNQLTARHDARSGVMVLNKYDVYGHKISMTDVDAGTTSYTYNYLHQIKDQTDAKGNKYSFTYDVLGRMTERIPAGGIYPSSLYYYYGASKNNRLQRVEIGLTITSYDYDAEGRVTMEKLQAPGKMMSRTEAYDLYGRNKTTGYSSGLNLLRTYDANGYMQIVRTNNPGVTPVILFDAQSMNGKGQYTTYRKANGLLSSVAYQYGIATHYNTAGIQDLEMNYDFSTGNLMSRRDNIAGYEEHFTYDNLDRLTSSQINKLTSPPASYLSQSVNYDAVGGAPVRSLGNIISKSDAGNYYYSPISKVHGVLRIDPPLGAISHNTQEVTYTVFNKPSLIKENGYEQTYGYDGNDERYLGELKQGGVTQRKRWYFGDYETDQVLPGGTERYIHYIEGGDGLCAIVVREGSTEQYYAAYTDHLGSILRLTDVSGSAVAIQNYDAWGRERNPMNWTYTLGLGGLKPDWLYRGYTGHEMLPEFDLVNMNARLYDPVNGRMLRPDNNITYPFNTQSYNRYSYGLNNPLSYVDPDGNNPIIAGLIIGSAMAASSYTIQIASSDGGFNNWNWGDFIIKTLSGGVNGGVAGGLGYGIGNIFGPTGSFVNELGRAGAHGFSNYLISGGDSRSFLSASFGSLAGSLGSDIGGFLNTTVGGTLFAAGTGGAASAIAGGNFLEGAGTGGIVHLVNQNLHKLKPASSYDYSKESMPGKSADDWDYVKNGTDGNMISRWFEIIGRDWNASSNQTVQDFKDLSPLLEVAPMAGIGTRGGKELFKFGGSAGRHMAEPGRAVPIQILEQAIKSSKGIADPKGSRALMHSVEMFRNGKSYKLDVLYDKATNTIWHFQYKP